MELLLSKKKEKKSRAFMILCDINLFIVIIIIRQLFKTHQTTQEKSMNLFFFSFCTPHHTFFQNLTKTTNNKKRGRASQINQIQFNHKVCCQNFFFVCFIYIYLVSHFQLAIQHYQDATTHLILSTSS